MEENLIIIYIQEHISDSEEIIKYSMFQWILFVIHKLMSSCIIGFMFTSHRHYTTNDLKIRINNQKTLHYINIRSKEVIVNISYPSTLNRIGGYMDAIISPTPVRCIIFKSRGCIEVYK